MAHRQRREPGDFLPRRLYHYDIRLASVLNLADEAAREELGLSDEALVADDLTACQEVGEAAHYAGFEAILAPSATGSGLVLAVFLDNIQPESVVEAGSYETWSARGQS